VVIPGVYNLLCEKEPFFGVHLKLDAFRKSPRISGNIPTVLFYSCSRRGSESRAYILAEKVPIARY
jgi:hypothetical protein